MWIVEADGRWIWQKALKEKGIDEMIQEARDSTTPETDAEHLKR